MATCFSIVGGIAMPNSEPAATCTGYVMLDQIDYTNWQTGLTNWSYDGNLMLIGFMGAVVCWVTGFGIGLVIAQVRKLRMS